VNKQICTIGAIFAFCIGAHPLSSQTPTAQFATWKDNRKAAYTIIHDDYSNYLTSIFEYAYPLATERGIKFSFGAITNTCGQKEWVNARTMMAKGHECINHSHSHKCGGTSCGTLDKYNEADFATELDLSTQLIVANTGKHPLFFIHPFDQFSEPIINRLKNLGYIGTRAGARDIVNNADFKDYMYMNYHVYSGSPETLAALNPTIDDVITKGGYSMREFHGIGDPYYGSISVVDYTNHLNYVKSKIDAGQLWSATASEVISYKLQRDGYQPVINTSDKAKKIVVAFTKLKNLDPSVFRTPLTLNLDLKDTAIYIVYQNGNRLGKTQKGLFTVNIYPHEGNLILEKELPEVYVKKEKEGAERVLNNVRQNIDNQSFINKKTVAFIYPNPAKDCVMIDIKNTEIQGNLTIELVSILGNIIKKEKIEAQNNPTFRFDIQGLNSGEYFIRVYGEDKKLMTQKIMIAQ
jgi:hypothetical protein